MRNRLQSNVRYDCELLGETHLIILEGELEHADPNALNAPPAKRASDPPAERE